MIPNCGGNHKILDWLLFWEPPTGATPQGVLPTLSGQQQVLVAEAKVGGVIFSFFLFSFLLCK